MPATAPFMCLNGEIVAYEDARLHAFSGVVKYGAGVFEGIRAYWSETDRELYVFRLPEHVERMRLGMRVMRFSEVYDAAYLTDCVLRMLRANELRENVHIRVIAFLDGDDLWTENWLVAAHALCAAEPRTIAHPYVDWVFGETRSLSFPPDQTDPQFDPATLRVTNAWDALCLAPRDALLEHPFQPRALAQGYAFEDWLWNLDTIRAGYVHRVVPDTIHFKRSRLGSQFRHATANQSVTRPTPYHDYAWLQEWEAARTEGPGTAAAASPLG